jgi:phosphate transport system substrate-binding protein
MSPVYPRLDPALPPYQPLRQVSGHLVSWGDPAFDKLMHGWTSAFGQFHSGVTFAQFLRGTSVAIGALYTGVAQLGLLGREIRRLERASWRRIFPYPPLAFAVATGAFDTFAKTVAVAVLVNRDNSLQRLTLSQFDAIYSRDRRRGVSQPITRWGQLGLTGAWVDKPITIYGLDEDTGTANFLQARVLLGGRWAPAVQLPPGAPSEMYAGSGGDAADALVRALEEDPAAIGIAGFRNITSRLKALALAEDERSPYVEGSRQTVASLHYPLGRCVYIAVNKPPDSLWDANVQEFLRFVLSREGQQVVADEGDYLPLPADRVASQWAQLA